jgi:hypothetical protein
MRIGRIWKAPFLRINDPGVFRPLSMIVDGILMALVGLSLKAFELNG